MTRTEILKFYLDHLFESTMNLDEEADDIWQITSYLIKYYEKVVKGASGHGDHEAYKESIFPLIREFVKKHTEVAFK